MSTGRMEVSRHSQVDPASFETKMLLVPALATPTKMRGVAVPAVPVVVSNVTNDMPTMSLAYPEESVGSWIYVPVGDLA